MRTRLSNCSYLGSILACRGEVITESLNNTIPFMLGGGNKNTPKDFDVNFELKKEELNTTIRVRQLVKTSRTL